jgi:hypothetical protein
MTHLEFLKVCDFEKKFRLGALEDGGYVVADLDGAYDCYISAGISNEESFSRDFVNRYGMTKVNSFGFDGTIHSYPVEYTDKVSFSKKNINTMNDANNTNLSHLTSSYANIFLKMDIEGCEYPWLLQCSDLHKFKQIVIEFHGINDDSWNCSYENKIKCFEKLSSTHYIVHAHGNNHGSSRNGIPDVIELTYVNKNYFASPPPLNRKKLPIVGMDFACRKGFPDCDLQRFPFVHL